MKLALGAIVSFHTKIQPNKMQQINDITHLGNIKNEIRHWRVVFHLYSI
jgi:hypothetical protein